MRLDGFGLLVNDMAGMIHFYRDVLGFEILQADEAFRPISFYDVGAFVWFARIIEWEFPGFSVDRCFDRLLQLQETIEREGKITGTTHRYLIVARKSC